MKKLILLIFMFIAFNMNAQDVTAKPVTYIAVAPCITNESGNFLTKFSPTIEIGRQFEDVFTMGIALGKTNCSRVISVPNSSYNFNTPIGTANKLGDDLYLELRPNLNVFQIGDFVNTFTTGVGYVFGPTPALMFEYTSGIEYSYSDTIHINVFYGNYVYTSFASNPSVIDANGDNVQGTPTHYSPSFIGISIVKFFKPTKLKGLIK